MAALIGILVSGTIFSLILTAKQNMILSSVLPKIHYDTVLATHHIHNALVHAGYEGCKASSSIVAMQGLGGKSGATLPTIIQSSATQQFPLEDLSYVVSGYEYVNGIYTSEPPSELSDVFKNGEFSMVDGTDILVVYHTSRASVQVGNTLVAGALTPIVIEDNSLGFEQGHYAYIGDCYKGDVFAVGQVFSAAGSVKLKQPGLHYPYDDLAQVRKAFIDILCGR